MYPEHNRFRDWQFERPAQQPPEEPPKVAAAVAGTGSSVPEQRIAPQAVKQTRERQLTRAEQRQQHFFE